LLDLELPFDADMFGRTFASRASNEG